MLVHIFGLDHFHQSLKARCLTVAGIEDEGNQKRSLSETLSQIVLSKGVQLIAEEGEPGCRSLGNVIADQHDIPRVDITMPVPEREKVGIKTPDYDRLDETRKLAYKVFEKYMFDRVKEAAADVTLVLCGRRHLGGLQSLFREAGDSVQMYDISSDGWYRGIPKETGDSVEGYIREG